MVDTAAIKSLTERNGGRAALALARDWLAIAGLIALAHWAHTPWLTLVCLWLIGAFQYAIGEALLHEGAHGNLFADKRLNDRLDWLYGLPFLRTMEGYKTEHLRHHGQLGRDGDYLVAEYEAFGLGRPHNAVWIWLVRPLIGWPALHYLPKLVRLPKRSKIRLAVAWGAAFAIAAISGLIPAFLLYWVVPLLWCRYAFLYWSEIADHHNTRLGTRTRLNPVINWFQHNKGYHAAHHRFPAVPWFNLPAAHAQLDRFDPDDVTANLVETWRQLARPAAGM